MKRYIIVLAPAFAGLVFGTILAFAVAAFERRRKTRNLGAFGCIRGRGECEPVLQQQHLAGHIRG